MANSTNSKFWVLDTAGIVTSKPVYVKNIQVTFKVASAGVVQLDEYDTENGAGNSFCYAKTAGATSAAADQLTQVFTIENWVQGVKLTTITDIAKLLINTG